MGAVLKLYDDQPEYNVTRKMKIPPQSEIAKYMEEKMGWSKDFCRYYSEKYWNHYQAQGWKLANGNSMKDWKAAFNSQWQTPKFKEDLDKLNQLKNKKENIDEMVYEAQVKYLNTFLMAYKNDSLRPDRETAEQVYQFLKTRGLLNLPKEALERAREAAGNRLDVVWQFELKEFMDAMVRNKITFG